MKRSRHPRIPPPPSEYITFWATDAPKSYSDDLKARGIRYTIEETRHVAQIHAGGPSIQYVQGCL